MACLKQNVEGRQKAALELDRRSMMDGRRSFRKEVAHCDVKTRSQMFSNVQCPHCDRKFSERAADGHIEHCKEKAQEMRAAYVQINASPTRSNRRS